MQNPIRQRGVFWVSLVLFTLPIGRAFAPQNVSGLVVEELSSDSTAAKAGIQPGDRVISYDNKPLPSPAAFDALQENTFGKKDVVLQLRRGDATVAVSVPLGKLGLRVRPELPPAAEKLYEEGKAALKAGEARGAIAKWSAAAKLAALPWLYSRVGETLQGQRQWKEASEAHLTAWALLEKGGDAAAQSRTLSDLGRCNQRLNDFPAAEKFFRQANQVDLASGNELWVASDLGNLGNVASDVGDLPAAQDFDSRSLAIRERLVPNSLAVSDSLSNLGSDADDRGDLSAAASYHTSALALRERLAPNSLVVAASLSNLGNVFAERGDFPAARDCYYRALSIQEQLAPNSLTLAIVVNNLGNVAAEAGDSAAAELYYARALQIREKLVPNSLTLAQTLNTMGALAIYRGDFAAAQSYNSRALTIQERLAPDSLTVARSLTNLGQVALANGDIRTAQDYASRALLIRERLAPNSLEVSESLKDLGKVAVAQGDLQVAQERYNDALQIGERLAPDSMETAETLADLAEAAFLSRHFTDARSFFARAITVIEAQRGHIPSVEARALFVAKFRSAYEGFVQTLLALNDLPGAFSASERARARSLLDLLSESHIDIRQGVEPSVLERERHLQESLNTKAERQTHLLTGKHTEQEAAAVAQEINSLTTEYHQIQATIRSSSPHYAALTQPQPLSLEEIQRQVLDPDSLLLEYSLSEDASSLFAVNQGSIKCYQLPKRSEIEALAKQTYEALTARNLYIATETAPQRSARILQAENNYPKLAARLSQLILAPAVAELGTKRLLIVADGDLLQIPFGVLADPAASSPQPLLVNHEIVSLPSASVIAVQRRELSKRKPAAKQLALFADPVFEHSDERVAALASLKDAKAAETASSVATRDISFERALSEARIGDDRSKIQRLPFSREEANAIFALTQQASSLKALDFDASKSKALGDEMSQYRIVHFATHALLNNDHPELSGIVLSLVDRQGHAVDGFLRLNEIYNLNLPADLVVLSACQTGLGKQIKGEGLIGLTRGFMYAGAQRVVASLWKVDDEATSELMGRFYEKMLKEGEPAAAALRHAEIEMSQQNRWRAAYFWAGFQMAGEWK